MFYNFGFFTLLAFAPFPLALGVHQLGYVFFGWGAMLAVFSVVVAPRLRARTGTTPLLGGALLTFAAVLLVMGIAVGSQAVLIAAVLIGGALIGLVNTVLTEALMNVAPDIDRPVASAAYSFVRFGGGAIAPWLAGKLSENGNDALPFYVAAGVVALSVAPLVLGRRAIAHVDGVEAHAPAPARPVMTARRSCVAVDGSPAAEHVTAEAARIALLRHRPVHVVHVQETDVVGDAAIALESGTDADAILAARLAQLRAAGVVADGEVLRSTGRHADVAHNICTAAGGRERDRARPRRRDRAGHARGAGQRARRRVAAHKTSGRGIEAAGWGARRFALCRVPPAWPPRSRPPSAPCSTPGPRSSAGPPRAVSR